jgi:hypothetical protein
MRHAEIILLVNLSRGLSQSNQKARLLILNLIRQIPTSFCYNVLHRLSDPENGRGNALDETRESEWIIVCRLAEEQRRESHGDGGWGAVVLLGVAGKVVKVRCAASIDGMFGMGVVGA